MEIIFEELSKKHQIPVIDIYNYYIKAGTAAFPDEAVTYDAYIRFLDIAEKYPAYAVVNEHKDVIGFCMLSDYIPHNSFHTTASLTYFILPEYTGEGIGSKCLAKLEEEAINRGISNLISDVSSENIGSIHFHKKHGFTVVGELNGIGSKFDRNFGLILLQKKL